MASWRDSASQLAQDDLDALLNMVLPFATQQLEGHGEFLPYGASLNDEGDARMVAAGSNEGERPASGALLESMVEGLRRQRDHLRAVAVVADVRLLDGDAVRVELEHREGQAITVLLPYKRKRFGRGIEYGGLTAGAAARQVWSA